MRLDDEYHIIDGHYRLAASRIAGKATIEARIIDTDRMMTEGRAAGRIMPTTNNPGAASAALPSSRLIPPPSLDSRDERLLRQARVGWRALDRTLAIPQIPAVPLEFDNARNQNGYYEGRYDGSPKRIGLSREGTHIGLTAAHEYGHYLDHQALPLALNLARDQRFASELKPAALDPWRQAVRASAAYQRLVAQQVAGTPEYAQAQQIGVSQKHLEYLSASAELWARAFAQWTATRSGDKTLLDNLRHATTTNHVVYYQWSDEDFAPIGAAMDKLFADLGWYPAPQRSKGKKR